MHCFFFFFVKIVLEQIVQDWHASSGLLSLPYLVCLLIFNPLMEKNVFVICLNVIKLKKFSIFTMLIKDY